MKKIIFVFSFMFLLMSCGTSTTIVSSWRDPDTTVTSEQFKKILVVALVKNESVRRTTENRLASIDPRFHASYSFLNNANLDISTEEKLKILKDENFDGVVTMRLVDTQKETTYVPGTNNYSYTSYGGSGYGYYGGAFGGWYGTTSVNYYDPGYYQETMYYIVETNIFSLTKNKLIWSGVSKSESLDDVGKTVDDIITEVIKEMRKDGSLPKE